MRTIRRAICSLNLVGFRAAVAAVKDKNLRGRPYVIAAGGRTGSSRVLVLDVSREALEADIKPGTPLAVAERRVRDLTILPPDPPAYEQANAIIEKIASRYAPALQNDGMGNLYLDLTGTVGLFGPAQDCASRVLREIMDDTGLEPAGAVACNKLVSKIGTRTIRPTGLIAIREGDEGDFLRHQGLWLLPGMGPKLLHTAFITGMREVGDLAALTDGEAISLFGRWGVHLRDTARGIDDSPVETGNPTERVIKRNLDFIEDVIDLGAIRGSLVYLAEHAGMELRGGKLGACKLSLWVSYSDGVSEGGEERSREFLVTDRDIARGAERVYAKAVKRRIRLRSLALTLGDLRPLGWSPDLFEPEGEEKQRKIQDAADKLRKRYGIDALVTGAVLAAPCKGLPGVVHA